MFKITYTGHLDYYIYTTRNGSVYNFNVDNDYSVTPDTWADFYEIILADKDPVYRNFVLDLDPASKTNSRRVSIDTYVVDPQLVRQQEEANRRAELVKEREEYIASYKRNIFNQIANGLREYPATLDVDALNHAEQKMREAHPDMFTKEEPQVEPTEELQQEPVEEPQVEEPKEEPKVELQQAPKRRRRR